MRKFGLILAAAAGLVASLMNGQAYALVCVGPITPVMPNATLPDTALGGGACFSAGDKTFGNISISNNVPPLGVVRFGFGPGTAIPHSPCSSTVFSRRAPRLPLSLKSGTTWRVLLSVV